MPEYVEREAIIQFIADGLSKPNKAECFGHDAVEILAEIEFMPAADVAPVVHGRYISTGYDEWYCDSGKCSNCGGDMLSGSKFCPNCGAKMKLEEQT